MYINEPNFIIKNLNKVTFLKPDGNIKLKPNYVKNTITINPFNLTDPSIQRVENIECDIGFSKDDKSITTIKKDSGIVVKDLLMSNHDIWFTFRILGPIDVSANVALKYTGLYGWDNLTREMVNGDNTSYIHYNYEYIANLIFTVNLYSTTSRNIIQNNLNNHVDEILNIEGYSNTKKLTSTKHCNDNLSLVYI